MFTRLSTAPRNFACPRPSCSMARCAIRRLVISEPTTKSTPCAMFAVIEASVTAITGGVSRSTQSKCCSRSAAKFLKRCDPSSSAGLTPECV